MVEVGLRDHLCQSFSHHFDLQNALLNSLFLHFVDVLVTVTVFHSFILTIG